MIEKSLGAFCCLPQSPEADGFRHPPKLYPQRTALTSNNYAKLRYRPMRSFSCGKYPQRRPVGGAADSGKNDDDSRENAGWYFIILINNYFLVGMDNANPRRL
ncbi:hypothetical protein [Pluralibacter gergoviae]|uniref:hypothetical protein n=1 Tax=Pluralibacter gergoviae TaxID=61647 RepID=UPI00155E1C31|nr:hypothetical protein [Pluralibacter gergoviae]